MTPDGLIEFKMGETVVTHLLRIGVNDTLYVGPQGGVFLKEDLLGGINNGEGYKQVDQLMPELKSNSEFCQRNYDLISLRMKQLSLYERELGNFTSYSDWLNTYCSNWNPAVQNTTQKPFEMGIGEHQPTQNMKSRTAEESVRVIFEMYMSSNTERIPKFDSEKWKNYLENLKST